MTDNQTSLAAQYNFDRFDHGRDRAIAEKYLRMENALIGIKGQADLDEDCGWFADTAEEALKFDPLDQGVIAETRSYPQPPQKYHSDCCGSSFRSVTIDSGATVYFCDKCDKPCDKAGAQLTVSDALAESINIVAEKGIWKDVPDAAEYIRNKRSSR